MKSWTASRPAAQHVAFGVVMAIVAVGFVRIAQYHWREGAALVGGALLVAAVFRAVLNDQNAGLLVIRRRGIDVLSYAGFGVLILYVALSITRGPLS